MSVEPLTFTNAPHRVSHRARDWRLTAAAALIGGMLLAQVPPMSLGARLEGKLFPIFSYQAIPSSSVTRSDHLLCWDWIRDKKRAPAPIDIDVELDTADGDRYDPEIFDARTGVPWHKGGALPPGSYVSQFCAKLPAAISDTTPVRLRQDLSYDGFLSLWTLHVPLPAIISD